MNIERPKYSVEEVDRAGMLVLTEEDLHVYEPGEEEFVNSRMNNWRESHAYPLSVITQNLKRHVSQITSDGIVAQRIKRFNSIVAKLASKPTLPLSKIQDIGGCRAVVPTLEQLRELLDSFKNCKQNHQLIKESKYIDNPPVSGYRSHHLVYEYQNRNASFSPFRGLLIEVQLRTKLQHSWATAVETVDTFTGQNLKSNREDLSDPNWRRFFALVGVVFAERESTRVVPKTPRDPKTLYNELLFLMSELDVVSLMAGYGKLVEVLEANPDSDYYYYLVTLNLEEYKLTINPYPKELEREAYRDFFIQERKIRRENLRKNAVLVSTDSITQLREAYPNYYADTDNFFEILGEEVQRLESLLGIRSST